MFVKIKNKKGQGTLEYAFVIAVIVGALIAMQIYIKRSMEGKMKATSDEIGEQHSAKASRYETITTSQGASQEQIETLTVGTGLMGGVVVTDAEQTSTSRSAEHISNSDAESIKVDDDPT